MKKETQRRNLMAAALANRLFLYRFAWRALASEADAAFLDVVTDAATFEEVRMLAGEASRAECALGAAAGFVRSHEDAEAALRSEYMKLFVGPGPLPAAPWESVYSCGEGLLFQESTLAVRKAYLDAGYKASGYPHEADDHVATELDFMAALTKEACSACDEGDGVRLQALLSTQERFLADHLNAWLSEYAERMRVKAKADTSCFYPCMAVFAAELCLADACALEELVGESAAL